MAVHHKYTFRLQLDLSQVPGDIWLNVEQTGDAGTTLLNKFSGTPPLSVKTLNNAKGDVGSGITLGVAAGRPGQAIFHAFPATEKGVFFDLTVTPAAGVAGVVGITLVSEQWGGNLPTTDKDRPDAFGTITWDAKGNFQCSGDVRGSGQGSHDEGFTGTMMATS